MFILVLILTFIPLLKLILILVKLIGLYGDVSLLYTDTSFEWSFILLVRFAFGLLFLMKYSGLTLSHFRYGVVFRSPRTFGVAVPPQLPPKYVLYRDDLNQ